MITLHAEWLIADKHVNDRSNIHLQEGFQLGKLAWRIVIMDDGKRMSTIGYGFGRKRDADLAIKALAKEGFGAKLSRGRLMEHELKQAYQIMIDAMQW